MGAGASNEPGPLAIAAVAEITRFDMEQLRVLKQQFQAALVRDSLDDEEPVGADASSQQPPDNVSSSLRSEPNLSLAQFEEALENADFFTSDRAIFDKLFTLMDRTGDAVIFASEFLIGICALLKGDLASKLQAAFELLQQQEKPQRESIRDAVVSKAQLAFILITMAQVVTYFGDPPMFKASVLSIVDDVFASSAPPPVKEEEEDEGQEEAKAEDPDGTPEPQQNSSALSSSELAARVVQHHTVDSYVRGHFVRRGTIVH